MWSLSFTFHLILLRVCNCIACFGACRGLYFVVWYRWFDYFCKAIFSRSSVNCILNYMFLAMFVTALEVIFIVNFHVLLLMGSIFVIWQAILHRGVQVMLQYFRVGNNLMWFLFSSLYFDWLFILIHDRFCSVTVLLLSWYPLLRTPPPHRYTSVFDCLECQVLWYDLLAGKQDCLLVTRVVNFIEWLRILWSRLVIS